MSQKIQIRRGSDSARQSVIFDAGEPLYTTDNKKMYIGDGSTLGGILIGINLNSNNCVIVETTSTVTGNGLNLINAITTAESLSPSINNPITVLIPPGVYETRQQITISSGYLSLVGLGNRENIIIRGGAATSSAASYLLAVVPPSNNVVLRNITLLAMDTGTVNIPSLAFSISSPNKFILDSVMVSHSGNSNTGYFGIFTLKNTSVNAGGTNGRLEAINTQFIGNWCPFPYGNGAPFRLRDSLFSHCYFSGDCAPYALSNNSIFKDCIFNSDTGICIREFVAGDPSLDLLNRYENCLYNRPVDGTIFNSDSDAQNSMQSLFSNCFLDGNIKTGLNTHPNLMSTTLINRNTGTSALQYIFTAQDFNIVNSTILNSNPNIPVITGNNVSGNIASCTLNSSISDIGNRFLTPNNATYTGMTIPYSAALP